MPHDGNSAVKTDNPILAIRGQVAEIVLNAPDRKNALSLSAWERIPGRLHELTANPEIRVCVIRGAGRRSFCAGADISEFKAIRSTPEAAMRYDAINVAAFKALKNVAVPVIAAIEGPCLGGGLGLALACDLRIASQTALFGIPAARLGLAYPPDALSDLLEVVSPSDAKKILFTGERFSAESALQMGLISEVLSPDALDARIEALCNAICANAPLSVRAAKQAVNNLSDNAAQEKLENDRLNARNCIDSADYDEGCRAFLEKREPVFSGR
ncbi:enoyl-CoA hydratase [Roseibium album]|uniref:Carnitinyl-CoA dehydratase n=1 Tax=Roseibium album TaxID=311410 RepID=A0A0M6ZPB3_9HYPH|nr:enoyl-CoA hydratase [Roseibium album]CTQ59065.1 Carnitinyl-CoA dehydratase [Roseibium album]CTQ64082.1 Carnitinyl-CoA dehydratase [Roseibium album]CTQ73794.1 Carnitinyl-CoA dehydratase [Roseibium album]